MTCVIFLHSLFFLLFFPVVEAMRRTHGTRRGVSLDELAVTIRDHPRSYFYSDRRGGFLVGSAGQGAEARAEWSVDGEILLRSLVSLEIEGKPVDQAEIDSVRVTPLEVIRFFRGGLVETTTLLDQVLGEELHMPSRCRFRLCHPRHLRCDSPRRGFRPCAATGQRKLLFKEGTGGSCAYSAGAQGEISPDGITVKQARSAACVVVFIAGDSADYLAQRTHGEVDLLRLSRRERMEKLLRNAPISNLRPGTHPGLRWLQLSLDG